MENFEAVDTSDTVLIEQAMHNEEESLRKQAALEKLNTAVAEIAKLTSDNYHTEAIVRLAEYIGEESLIKRALTVKKKHMEIGHITIELNDIRENLYTSLMMRLSYGERQKLWRAF